MDKGKILILGGAGYIGNRLVPYLRMSGYQVTSWDLEWFGGPVADYENVRKDVADLKQGDLSGFGSVVLLAGHSSVPICKGQPESTFRNNVANFAHLLEILPSETPLYYASSSGIYGNLGDVTALEDETRLQPKNYYDLSKRVIDEYALLSGKRTCGLRFGTVNGWSPNCRGDLMINMMVRSAWEDGVLRVSNPEVVRPILGLGDLCRALDCMLYFRQGITGIWNLFSFNMRVDEIALRVQKVAEERLGKTVPIQLLPPSPTYNMSIGNRISPEKKFGWWAQDTVESLAIELFEKYDTTVFTDRRTPRAYP